MQPKRTNVTKAVEQPSKLAPSVERDLENIGNENALVQGATNGVFHDLGHAMDEVRCSWFIGENATPERLREIVEKEDVAAYVFEERDKLYGKLASAFGGLACVVMHAQDLSKALAAAKQHERAESKRLLDLCWSVGVLRSALEGARKVRDPKTKRAAIDAALDSFSASIGRYGAP
jgi:hypothetical protein